MRRGARENDVEKESLVNSIAFRHFPFHRCREGFEDVAG